MKKILTIFLWIPMALMMGTSNDAKAQAFVENFDDITLLSGNGWFITNLSSPVGSTSWFQGTAVSATGPFDSYNGAANSYIAANYNSTGSTGTISNWLMTPNRTFRNGDVLTFYTRKASPDSYADRLEVRLSTNGASTNAGASAAEVGDFTTLLLSINPSLVLGVYPTTWTMYTITISGLPAPTSGRVAFHYFVTGGGLNGTSSDYIGIDALAYTPYVCPAITLTPGGALTGGVAGDSYSNTLIQTGALGAPSFAVTAGALPPGLTLSAPGTISGTPTATGTFNFTVTAMDNSGCTGSQAYSITVVCPPNVTSLAAFPELCNNSGLYTLVEGSPAGGEYSGTGVSSGQFNPASLSQTITYSYTDPYGCFHSSSSVITVHEAPIVNLSAFDTVCSNAGMITLTGGTPAGGGWIGTSVSGDQFDPAMGSQLITYTYTDTNTCTQSAMGVLTVNAAPVVTLDVFDSVCSNAGLITLSGGSPAGGSWSGVAVSGDQFDPSLGSQMITYSYTDTNACSANASQTLVVNTAPVVTAMADTNTVCAGGAVVFTASGALNYTWSNGATNGVPFAADSSGTYTVTGTDEHQCSATASVNLSVLPILNVTASAQDTFVCLDDAEVSLIGLPHGGTWTGAGVSDTSFNPSIAGAGTHALIYTYENINFCTSPDTVYITVDPCYGIMEHNAGLSVLIYPDPNDGHFILESDQKTSVTIVDFSGRMIFSQVLDRGKNNMDISRFSAGIYTIIAKSDQSVRTLRMIKK